MASHQEEAIDLVVVKDSIKEVVKCFPCDDVFDSISLFEDHMSSVHQIDRQTLKSHREFVLNKTTVQEGNLNFIFDKCFATLTPYTEEGCKSI